MKTRRLLLSSTLAILLAMLPSFQRVRAAIQIHSTIAAVTVTRMPSGISEDSLRRFDTAFDSLSKSNRLTIIAEGMPLQPNLSVSNTADLKRNLESATNSSIPATVSTIAAAYDYQCEAVSPNLFLLRKRYSDPNDLPCVTYGEVVHALQAIIALMDTMAPAQGNEQATTDIVNLYATLTPAQIVRAGHGGIAGTELNTDQRTLAIATAQKIFVESNTSVLRMTLKHLLELRNPKTVFTWMKLSDRVTFGYQGPFRDNGSIRKFPMTNGFRCQVGGGYQFSRSPLPTQSPSMLSAVPDPSRPTSMDRALASGMLSNRLPCTQTLGQVADALTSERSSGVRVAMDNAISQKPVCLFGQKYIDSNHLVRAITTLYGLTLRTSDNRRFAVLLPQIRSPRDMPEAAKEISRMIPGPLRSYFYGQANHIAQSQRHDTNLYGGDASQRHGSQVEASARFQAMANAQSLAINAGYYPVVRRLVALAEPSVPSPKSPPVAVASLGPESERLIALLMLSGAGMDNIHSLVDLKVPDCLLDPGTIAIEMGMSNYPGSSQTSILSSFGQIGANGQFKGQLGMSISRNMNH